MFRNRRISQKPSDELYSRFKANFGNVIGATSAITTTSSQYSLDAVSDPVQLGKVSILSDYGKNGLRNANENRTANIKLAYRSGFIQEWNKELDTTPRAHHDGRPLTISDLDPNSLASSTDAKQIPEYFTRGGAVNTPRAGMGTLGRPLSTQASEADVHDGTRMAVAPYPQVTPYSFRYSSLALHAIQEQPPQSYAPATSPHQGTGYDTMGLDGSPIHDISGMGRMEVAMRPEMATDRQVKPNVAAQVPPPAENFRFRVVLHAPTAMIKSADSIPITYLNRGKVYSVSIVDTQPMLSLPVGARYHTSLRISFAEEHQRQQPASCWQLWKESYSYTEWPQRGGKVQAVEYVEAIRQAGADDKRTHVELATASIDGFSIVWTPGTTGLAECRLRVRFNFLSTDFSHSKGVKGIPVRLCAKTVALGQSTPHAAFASTEVAYCKVKLFRAHGAERKLSNDVAHVNNMIDKLKQRVALSEADMKGFGKSKRSISMSKSAATQNAGSIPKRKHALSFSSASSTGGYGPFEEGLHYKLLQQQDMLTSTRPVSILHLSGVKQDDPDLHPIALLGSPSELMTVVSHETSAWQRRASMLSNSTASISSLVSPSQNPISLHSGATVHGLAAPVAAQWTDYQADLGVDLPASPQHFTNPADKLTKVPKMDDAGSCSSWIEALGVDEAYCPPLERMVKAVACFYVLYRDATHLSQKPYYRAVYLTERTLINLLAGIGSKCGINPSTVRRSLHILSSGLEVEMDDNMVWGMPDGQDMVLEVKELSVAATTKAGREITINGVDAEGDCAWREMCDIRLLF